MGIMGRAVKLIRGLIALKPALGRGLGGFGRQGGDFLVVKARGLDHNSHRLESLLPLLEKVNWWGGRPWPPEYKMVRQAHPTEPGTWNSELSP
jgi:hypothetical protein